MPKRRRGSSNAGPAEAHKERQSRDAERNARQRDQARAAADVLRDPRALRAEIDRIRSEEDGPAAEARATTLERNLAALMERKRRHLELVEREARVSKSMRGLAGASSSVGGVPPPDAPRPQYGPGLPPPSPPPHPEDPEPYLPPPSVPPPVSHVRSLPPPGLQPQSVEDLPEEAPRLRMIAPPSMLPTSVALSLAKIGTS